MKIWINGKFYPKASATINVMDHGLLYGDGVFEGLRVYGGKIFRCVEHLDRLFESANTILLSIPMTKEVLTQSMILSVRANKVRDGYIRRPRVRTRCHALWSAEQPRRVCAS